MSDLAPRHVILCLGYWTVPDKGGNGKSVNRIFGGGRLLAADAHAKITRRISIFKGNDGNCQERGCRQRFSTMVLQLANTVTFEVGYGVLV